MRPGRLEARTPAANLNYQKPHTHRPRPHPRAFLQDFRYIEISMGLCLNFHKKGPNFVYKRVQNGPEFRGHFLWSQATYHTFALEKNIQAYLPPEVFREVVRDIEISVGLCLNFQKFGPKFQ